MASPPEPPQSDPPPLPAPPELPTSGSVAPAPASPPPLPRIPVPPVQPVRTWEMPPLAVWLGAAALLFGVVLSIAVIFLTGGRRAPFPKPMPIAAVEPAASAGAATGERPFVNSLGMRFVPAGTEGVLMSVWETRVSDYAAFAEARPDKVPRGTITMQVEEGEAFFNHHLNFKWSEQASWKDLGFAQQADHPAAGLSLLSFRAFAAWLTETERAAGKIPAEAIYAVPTDEEWSAAAGESDYPWGSQWTPAPPPGNYWDAAAIAPLPGWNWKNELELDDGAPYTAPVGCFPPNSHGLHDLGGNVAEWCDSVYDPGKNSPQFLKRFTHAARRLNSRGDTQYPQRGGSWYSRFQEEVESSAHYADDAWWGDVRSGGRLVLITAPRRAADFRRRAWHSALAERHDEVIADLDRALALEPADFLALRQRAILHNKAGRYAAARADYEALHRHHPQHAMLTNSFAWLLATCPDDAHRDGARAVELALEAVNLIEAAPPALIDTLAAAYAETGDWEKAVSAQEDALAAVNPVDTETRADLQSRLDLYKARQPYRLKRDE